MRRTLLILSGVLVLALLAAGLTEAALAIGHRGTIADDAVSRTTTPTPGVSSTPTPTPSATPAVTSTPTPVTTPVAHTATTTVQVRLRVGASTSSAMIAWIDAGTVVTLGNYVDASWQEVTVNGLNGYIFRAYLAY